jgi:gentisate 1,2-dioxygenase
MTSTDQMSPDSKEEYLKELAEKHMSLPFLPDDFVVGPTPDEVKAPYKPFHWSWPVVESMVMGAAEIMKPGPDAHRRIVQLNNPSAPGSSATHTLAFSVQLVMPGEEAPSHHHTLSAVRFVLKGIGATVVDGEPCTMMPGDLVLTPNWSWHGHKNESEEPLIWLDILDGPLVYGLRSVLYEDYPDGKGAMQPPDKSRDSSMHMFSAGSLRPTWHRGSSKFSPQKRYPWHQTVDALEDLSKIDASEFDDIALEYKNPVTGGHVMPTLACAIQMLRPGIHTKAHRHSTSSVQQVFRGEGYTVVDGVRIDWKEGDFFVLPPWAWHEHINTSPSNEAVVFSVSDLPTLEALGLYREDPFPFTDGYQEIASVFSLT